MIFTINIPSKKERELLKGVLQELRRINGDVPYWRLVLTILSEKLNELRNNELKNAKAKNNHKTQN